MKALTVQSPFAQLIASGSKTIEVRSRKTSHRGDVLICVGKTIHQGIVLIESASSDVYGQDAPSFSRDLGDLNLGRAICIARLYDVVPFDYRMQVDAKILFDEGYYAWCLDNIRLIEPFAVRGMPGLFNVEF